MTEDSMESLLKRADSAAGPPRPVSVDLPTIRRRASRRRIMVAALPACAAAVILLALCIPRLRPEAPSTPLKRDRIATLEAEVIQLKARTQATLNLIQEVLEDQREQQRLEQLHAEAAAIPDPLEEIGRQTDRTAFILVYQADRLYRELDQARSAVEAYNRVIELFPKNRWAEVARQRLAEIRDKKLDKTSLEGDSLWKPRST
jgi:tetratricopeptide (TPR) repeat protein